MPHLFAYGTLMSRDILRRVAGVELVASNGTLEGFRRLAARGEEFPAMVPSKGDEVEGVVYWQVPAFAWRRLDRFEGKMYRREVVSVSRLDGRRVLAGAYLAGPAAYSLLTASEWDPDRFRWFGKARFERCYAGYGRL